MTSPSSLSQLERCPLERWNALRSVAATEPNDDPADGDTTRALGTAVHAVLSWVAKQPTKPTAAQVQERVNACAVSPSDLEEVARLSFVGWRRMPAHARILGAEVELELDLTPDGSISGRLDLVVDMASKDSNAVEIWDWKTGFSQLDPDELLCDPQALTYWAWAQATYPGREIVLRWVYLSHDLAVTARPRGGLGMLRALLRAEARLAARKDAPPGRPGLACARCAWRSGCTSRLKWLAAPLNHDGDHNATMNPGMAALAPLGVLYREASARAKVSEQERKDLGVRLLALCGAEKKIESDGIKVTRVRQERAGWPVGAVRLVADAAGIDPAALWEQVGTVRTAALDICVGKLSVEQAETIEAEREVRSSEYVRVSGERV